MKRGIAGGLLFALLPALLALAGLFMPLLPDRPHMFAGAGIAFGDGAPFTLTQPFGGGCVKLAGVALGVQNPGGRAFSIRLARATGEPLGEVDGGRGSGMRRFLFPESGGTEFLLNIAVKDGGPRIDFAGDRHDGAERLAVNGAPAAAHLYLMPLCRASAGETASLILGRIGMEKPFLYRPLGMAFLLIALDAGLFGLGFALFFRARKRGGRISGGSR